MRLTGFSWLEHNFCTSQMRKAEGIVCAFISLLTHLASPFDFWYDKTERERIGMDTFQKLEQLTALAKKNETLRLALLKTRDAKDPLMSFCKLAQESGVELYIGELFAVGQEYSDNQCKSTNGGNPTPYDAFDDAYENFLASLA